MLEVDIDAGQIRLKGQATIYFAEELKRELARAITLHHTVVVNMGGLDALDMSGAQLLAALRRSYGPERVTFTECPVPIRELLEVSGLDHCLFQQHDARQGGSWSKTR